MLTELEPFMTVNEDKSVTFDSKAARKEGITAEDIRVGQEFVDMQNEMMQVVKKEGMDSPNIDRAKVKKFERFFLAVANGNRSSAESGEATAQASGDVCGGSQSNPHPCPLWQESRVYRSSEQAITEYLWAQGFHRTLQYASYGNPYDFTEGCDAYGCSSPIFRTQAIIYQSGSQWTYRYQTPEPNPEIYDYVWPVYWWGSYVQWWHENYC
ncbi:MAG: hypothetical protein HRF40_04120 [Nitrososphaera sp.]